MSTTITSRAEVVAEDETVAGRFRGYLEDLGWDVRTNPEVEPSSTYDCDLVIYHVPSYAMKAERRQKVRPRRAGMDEARLYWLEAVQQISERAPAAQILVAVAPGEHTADRALDSGATDVIEETITPGIFRRRMEMLGAFRHLVLARRAPRDYGLVLELPLAELRNERSGRIDAQAVATYMGISLKRLANATGIKYAGLHKTPDSPRAQEALRPLVRVLELANRAFGNGEQVRRWLNRPLYELEDDSPLAVILAGEVNVVKTLLENALTGIPV